MAVKADIYLKYGTLPECIKPRKKALPINLSSHKTKTMLERLNSIYSEVPSASDRAKAFAISMELSRRSVAPRWQFDDADDGVPLRVMAKDVDEQQAIKHARIIKQADAIYFDLLWLAIAYPEHITQQDNWQWIFRHTGDWVSWLETADNIANRVGTPLKKSRWLGLNEEQKIGCRYLCAANLDKEIRNVEKRIPAIQRKIEKDTKSVRQRNQLDIEKRAKTWAAGKISNWSPSKAARVRTMMTGDVVTKQAMSLAFKKVKKYG